MPTSFPTRASRAAGVGAAAGSSWPTDWRAFSRLVMAAGMGSMFQIWKCLRRMPAMSWSGATWSTQPRSKAARGMP